MAQIGLVSISFRALSADDIVRLCTAAKLPCIEWGSDIHAVPENREALLHIRELQSRSGISSSSYGTYFKLGKSDPQEFSKYLDASDILGTEPDIVSQPIEDDVDRHILHKALACLGEREKKIICMRYGFGLSREMTQKEVADLLGISQSYISRLEKRIISKLRRNMQKMM